MAYDDYQTQGQAATSGSVPQAIARKNARRGGTPNAPEVNDEPGPGAQQAIAAPNDPEAVLSSVGEYAPGGAAARALPGDVTKAYEQGGIGSAIGAGVRGLGNVALSTAADISRGVGGAVKLATDVPAQALKTLVTGDAAPIGQPNAAGPGTGAGVQPPASVTPPAPAAPSAPSFPNAGSGVDAGEAAGQQVATPAPQSGVGRRGALPAGVAFDGGNTYSGVGQPAATPGIDPIAQANERAAAQLAAMRTRDDAANQSAQQANAAGNNAIITRADAQKAQREADVANFLAKNGSEVLHGGIGSHTAAATANRIAATASQRAAGLQAIAAKAQSDTATAGARPIAAENAIISRTQDESERASANRDEDALLNPYKVQAAQQGVAGAQTQQQIAKLTLAQHQRVSDLEQAVADAKTPEDQAHALAALRGVQGGSKVAVIDVDTGAVDPVSGQPIYKKGAIDLATGNLLGAGTAAAGGKTPGPAAPPADAIAYLKKNPKDANLAAQFELKYGKGSAAQYLGGQ